MITLDIPIIRLNVQVCLLRSFSPLAQAAWGQRRSGRRAAAVGQLRTRRHGAAQD